MMFWSVVGNALVIGLGIYLYRQGAATLGSVYLFYHYMTLLEGPLERISNQFQEFQKAGAGFRRVQDLLKVRPQITDGEGVELPERRIPLPSSTFLFYGNRRSCKGSISVWSRRKPWAPWPHRQRQDDLNAPSFSPLRPAKGANRAGRRRREAATSQDAAQASRARHPRRAAL